MPDELLPTVAGMLTAAALRQSPVGWRRGLGRLDLTTEAREAIAWAYAVWLLVDLLDFAVGKPGATATLTDELFRSLLADDEDLQDDGQPPGQ